MFGIRKPARERTAKSPLAATLIDRHLVYTASDVTAWFKVPTQRWSYLGDGARLNLVIDAASRVSGLSGKRIHARITSRPMDAEQWAADLLDRTPRPLPGYKAHLRTVRDHLAVGAGSEKHVYLGVQVAVRHVATRATDQVMGRAPHALRTQAERETDLVAESLAGAGIEAVLATPVEVEWLMRRSIELGMPTPEELSPVEAGGIWEADDINELTEAIEHDPGLFADAVKVRGWGRLADVERWVSVLTVGRVDPIEVPDTAHVPWLAETDRLPFPVEWSIRLTVLDGDQAKSQINRKLLVTRDMQKHYRDHDMDEPLALERQAQHARTVEDEMISAADVQATRVHGWFRVAVWGDSRKECLERARKVIDQYRKRQVTIAHPRGGQWGLVREFIPGEPLSNEAYQRRLPVLYFTAGMPQASSRLGDDRGPYIGHTTVGARRAVCFDTHFATEIRETSGLVPIVGGLGAGKSVLEGLITYEAARRGITSVMLDPSGPLAGLCDLPELRGRSRHLDLTAAPSGALSPFGVIPNPRPEDHADLDALEEARVLASMDRKLLALDIATMLLPSELASKGRTRLLLTEAIRSTKGSAEASLWTVVEYLEQRDQDAQEIAAYLRDMAEMPLARLFFPQGTSHGPELDATLTVLTMPGLILPPGSVPREHWSTTEQLAVPLLHLASWYATRTIYGRPRSERKLVALDETHFLGEWGAGRALFTRLGRDSRKWNTCVLAASQNPADVLSMEVSNFISAAFVGKIEDEQVAADALRLLRVPTGVGYEPTLAKLSPRSANATRSGVREFVMRDVDGNVDKMRVDMDHLPQVLAALDTTASPMEKRTLTLGVA